MYQDGREFLLHLAAARSLPDVILSASWGHNSVEVKLSDASSVPLYELHACRRCRVGLQAFPISVRATLRMSAQRHVRASLTQHGASSLDICALLGQEICRDSGREPYGITGAVGVTAGLAGAIRAVAETQRQA